MSEVKRYRDTESFLDGREVVLATDYSSLLAVLRRCVGHVVQSNARLREILVDVVTGNYHTIDLRDVLREGEDCVASAREYLEEADKWK